MNWEGMAVPYHLADQLAEMEALLQADQEQRAG
jgi:hypothetical protein